MEQILPTNEIIEVEGKTYTNPQTGIDETNTFIDNLRATQGQQNQEIMTDTQMLGTDVPSVQGGLIGPESYFTSRYQTPFTNATVANLRATAQAQALNEVLANEQAIWKNRYQQAYRNYQKRARARARAAASGGGGTTISSNGGGGGVNSQDNALTGQGRLILDESDLAEGGAFLVEPVSGNIIGEGFRGDNPRAIRNADGSYTKTKTSSSSNNKLSNNSKITNTAPLANALRSRL